MDQLIKIISGACLKHHDSGETSVNKEARLILKELENNGYKITKNTMIEEEYGVCIDCSNPVRISETHYGIKGENQYGHVCQRCWDGRARKVGG